MIRQILEYDYRSGNGKFLGLACCVDPLQQKTHPVATFLNVIALLAFLAGSQC